MGIIYKKMNEHKMIHQKILPHCTKLTDQLSFKLIKLKVDRYTSGNAFPHGSKHKYTLIYEWMNNQNR